MLAAVEPVVEAPAPVQEAPKRRFAWWPRSAAIAVPVLAVCVIGLVVWNVSLRNDLNSTTARSPTTAP